MERLRFAVVIFAAALSLVRGVPSPLPNPSRSGIQLPVPGGIQEPIEGTCREYCDVKMGFIDKVLRLGEKVTSPDDPCITYTCSGNDELLAEVTVCEEIEFCPDGEAPYLLPEGCCKGCDYLNPLTFSLEPSEKRNGSEVDPDITSPPPNSWSEWSSFTECSRSCGGGRHSRMRECITTNARELDCVGLTVDIRPCNTFNCPIDGGWTEWDEWSECSATCDNGTQTRHRSCTNPLPQYGGKDCEGERTEVRQCFLRHCPVDCVWLEWSDWGNCSHECGGGIQFRSRDQLPEQYGGEPCNGSFTEMQNCNEQHCPVHGGWSLFSLWSECSTTCDEGIQTRTRECNNPPPAYGGDNCTGVTTETQPCQGLPHCPVDCSWNEWSNWTECSVSCDGGSQSRNRTFEPAMYNGRDCTGPSLELRTCNTQKCPNPCVDAGFHPCYNDDVECTKLSDTEFSCGDCPRGMEGDGINCTGINECDLANPCFPGVECTEFDNGFACADCPTGYTGSPVRGYDLHDAQLLQQVCTDVDECQVVTNGGCHEYRVCNNTEGSFVCGPCIEGYVEVGDLGCKLANPCAAGENDCERPEYCINHVVGEYYCECPPAFVGNGRQCAPDPDLDGVPNTLLTIGCDNPPCPVDNCPDVPNSGQRDQDNDGIGDICDDDNDNDGIPDDEDNCKFVYNPRQTDVDGDNIGDACDVCRLKPDPGQGDIDGDGLGDGCDADIDGDGILNILDNCYKVYNPEQEDRDGDRYGDACDNCPKKNNRDQSDDDMDGVGNICDKGRDNDGDGIKNSADNCRGASNPDQCDHDGDGRGDRCDPDDDNDGVLDADDNCPLVANPDQTDSDGDGKGDACETDYDGDGVADNEDVCPANSLIQRTSFFNAIRVRLDKRELQPYWNIISETEVIQNLNSGPGLLLSRHSFRDFEFTGTFYVDTHLDNDYFGLVFNYYNNKRFMIVAWKRSTDAAYWVRGPSSSTAEAGLQIRVMDSADGPYTGSFKSALWSSARVTRNQAKTLWKDPNGIGWEHKTAYRWNLQYSAVHKCTRVRIYQGGNMIIDSGCQCDTTGSGAMAGGKLGLYTFSQPRVLFSDMRYSCLTESQLGEFAQCQAN